MYQNTIPSKIRDITFSATKYNLHIENSYQIISKPIMEEILKDILEDLSINTCLKYKRSIKSWVNEWVAHNWLNSKKIANDRTKDVDLNEDESLLKRAVYWIISNFLY